MVALQTVAESRGTRQEGRGRARSRAVRKSLGACGCRVDIVAIDNASTGTRPWNDPGRSATGADHGEVDYVVYGSDASLRGARSIVGSADRVPARRHRFVEVVRGDLPASAGERARVRALAARSWRLESTGERLYVHGHGERRSRVHGRHRSAG